MIYLDNAATSWPKPPEVLKAMTDVLEHAGGNPGRSGHRLSIAAARLVYEAREATSSFFNLGDPMRVIFTNNATHALNIVIHGILKSGDNVIASSMEHNAVMRPLRDLEKQGVQVNVVKCKTDGTIDGKDLARTVNSGTRLIVMVHASNVTGTILPVAEAAKIAHKAGALLLIDSAQTAGVLPIDVKEIGADFIAFTGHKGPQGPTGIGGLLIHPDFDVSRLPSLMQGGTGSRSGTEEQPDFLPDKYESGTANLVGIAGLLAGINWVTERVPGSILSHERELVKTLIEGLSVIPKIKVYGTLNPGNSAPIVSFTVSGKVVSDIGLRLDEEFGILARVGIHCAPAAHHTIGTFPEGTVRLAPGVFTTMDDVKKTLKAIEEVANS